MKKKDGYLIWSQYFDLNKSRSQGRRVPRNLAVSSPKFEEILEAAKNLGVSVKGHSRKAYPRTPYEKGVVILVEKKGSKTKIIRNLAVELSKIRSKRKQ